MSEQIQKKISDNATTRWVALIIVSMTMMCGYFLTDVMSPLESLLNSDFGWKSSEFGDYAGSYSWFNVYAFMLVIGGIILDKWGIRVAGLLSCVLMLGGAFAQWYAVKYMNADLLTTELGYATFGMGCEIAGVTVSKSIVKWFTGHELATALGLQVATARIGTGLAMFCCLPIAMKFGGVATPLLIGVLAMLIGLVAFSYYCILDKKFDREKALEKAEAQAAADDDEEGFKLRDIVDILSNPGFWFLSLLCLLFYSGVFPFLKFATNIMIFKYGVDPSMAGSIPSLLPFGCIILTPIFGGIYDKVGKGVTLMVIGSALLMVVHILFALPVLNYWWFAAFLMILLGIAFSLVPSAMWPSLPKIVPMKKLGTANALIFYIQNIGLMLVPKYMSQVIESYAQTDASGKVVSCDYTVPMFIFASFGAIAIILALILKALDSKKHYGLQERNIK